MLVISPPSCYSVPVNVTLPKDLEDFVAEQVKGGRFGSKNEVLSTALRQLEESERQREMKAFKEAFQEVDRHSPAGEPTSEDLAEIDRIVKSVRTARRQRRAA